MKRMMLFSKMEIPIVRQKFSMNEGNEKKKKKSQREREGEREGTRREWKKKIGQ